MFNRCNRDFAELARALKRASCPLCSVVEIRTHALVRSAAAEVHQTSRLCGDHLALVLEHFTDSKTKADLLRAVIDLYAAEIDPDRVICGICLSLDLTEGALRRSIQRLSRQARFQTALKGGPLFCHKHYAQICLRNAAPDFMRIERAKFKRLADRVARVNEINVADADRLAVHVLAYLRPFSPHTSSFKAALDSGSPERRDTAG